MKEEKRIKIEIRELKEQMIHVIRDSILRNFPEVRYVSFGDFDFTTNEISILFGDSENDNKLIYFTYNDGNMMISRTNIKNGEKVLEFIDEDLLYFYEKFIKYKKLKLFGIVKIFLLFLKFQLMKVDVI